MEEIWRPVVGYEGLYEVSSYGRVRRVNKGLLKLQNVKGYNQVCLYKCGIRKIIKVHRMVAIAFIPNPDNLPQVNHRDEVKSNNCVENLEWCDNKYNNNYGTKIERHKQTMFNLGYWKEGNNNKDRYRKYYYLHRDEILQKKREKYKNSK